MHFVRNKHNRLQSLFARFLGKI